MSSPLVQAWLRENVAHYPAKDRVYADIDNALASFQTLRPKSDVYTFDDGRTQLLLCLHGLLPINYRGATYNIPLAVWVVREYPRQPPLVYVVPTSDMLVRAGRYLDPSGRCNHEYLRNWQRKDEGCNLSSLLEDLQDQFSREPPVYAKPQPERDRPPPPPPPPVPARPGAVSASPLSPPQPLPKPSTVPTDTLGPPAPPPASDGPPPPPQVPPRPRSLAPSRGSPIPIPAHKHGTISTVNSQPNLESSLAQPWNQISNHPAYGARSPPTHLHHLSPSHALAHGGQGFRAPPHASSSGSQPQVNPPPPPVPPPPPIGPQGLAPSSAGSSVYRPSNPGGSSHYAQLLPVPNLLDDDDLVNYSAPPHTHPLQHLPDSTLGICPAPAGALTTSVETPPTLRGPGYAPAHNAPVASPPPRPPNPELLSLHSRVHDKLVSSLHSLQTAFAQDAERLRASQRDLLAGEPAIRDEMARLEAVKKVCESVSARVGECVRRAEGDVARMRERGDVGVDEVVCAMSIVHNQLLNLVAEDNAIEDTIYHLHRALNSGRIDLERFLRTTRVLAEEQFMKRALINKIQAGLSASNH